MKILKHFPLTVLGILMLLGSIGLYFIKPDFKLPVIYLLSFSHLMLFMISMLETKKKPFWMYAVTYFSTLVVGGILDSILQSFPWLTVALVFWNSSFMLRHIFFHRWGLLKYRWVEFVSWGVGFLAFLPLLYSSTSKLIELLPMMVIGMVHLMIVIFKHYYDYVQSKDYYFQKALQVGDPVPHIQLPDEEGKVVDLYADYVQKKKPVLLFFTRGEWCPFCYVMLRSFEKHYQLFRDKGIEVLAINPDSISNNQYKKQILNLHYRLLYDSDMDAVAKFGFFLPKVNPAAKRVSKLNKGLPLPAVILVDQNGKIAYISKADEEDALNPQRIYELIEKRF